MLNKIVNSLCLKSAYFPVVNRGYSDGDFINGGIKGLPRIDEEKCPSYSFIGFNPSNIQHTNPSGKYSDALANKIPIGWALSQHTKLIGYVTPRTHQVGRCPLYRKGLG